MKYIDFFLPYPAVPEKLIVDIIFSSTAWTSITICPHDSRYSQPDDPEQQRLEDRICPTRWDSKMRFVRYARWPEYPGDRYQVPDGEKYTIQSSTLPRNLDDVPPREYCSITGRPRWPSSARSQHRCVTRVSRPPSPTQKFKRCELFPRRSDENKYRCGWCSQ